MRPCLTLARLAFLAVLATPVCAQDPLEPSAEPDAEQETAETGPGAGTATLNRADVEAWLDGFLPYALQRGGIAGAVVAVVNDGEVVLKKGYGWADVENRLPVDADRTLFRPGSVAKLVTWTAVMQLVQRGEIDLDADINGYLDFEVRARDGEPVTMRQIMTHTAGFEERIKSLIVADAGGVRTLAEYIPAWVPERIFAPGSTPAYSNYATGLAGYVVERVSGQAFDDYLDEHIFQPLGMADSTFRQPLPARLEPDMSKGYPVASEDAQPYEMVNPAPAGSLASTAADMATFMIAHLQEGRYEGVRILEANTAREMHRTFLTMLPPLNRMALGFFETNTNGRQVIAHLGDTQWFHTALHLFVDDGVGLYFSTNSLGKDGAAGPIRGALFEMFADRYLPGPEPHGSVPDEVAREHASRMAGVYENSRRSQSNFFSVLNLFGQVKVSDNGDGTLTVAGFDDLAGAPATWQEIEPYVWVETNGEQRLAAEVVDGTVRRFSVDGLSPFMVFEPAPAGRSSSWLLPALQASLAALLMTALLWPVSAIVRRRFGATLPLDGADLRAYRWSKIAALSTLVVLGAWMGAVLAMTADLSLLSPSFDPVLLGLQVLSFIVFAGSLVVMLWNAVRAWTGARRWPARTWSIVLVLASLTVMWLAVNFQLIGFNANY